MMKNNNLRQRDKIEALYTAVVGIPGTAEKGLVGDVKDLKRDMNQRYNKLNKRVWALIIALSASGILGANLSGLLGG